MPVEAPEAPASPIQTAEPPAEAAVSTDFIRKQFEDARAEIPEMRTAQEALDRRNAKRQGKANPLTEKPVETKPEAKVETPKEEKPVVEAKAEKPEKTEDAPDDDKINQDGLSPEAREALVKYKRGFKEQSKKAQELEAKLKEFSSASEELNRVKAELSAKEKMIEEANKELYVHRIEATPEWKKAVHEPTEEILNQMEFLAQRHSIDGNKIAEAVYQDSRGNSGPLEALLEGQSDREKQRYYALSDNLMQIEKRKGELKQNSKEAYETSLRKQEEDQKQYLEKTKQDYQKAAEAVNERFTAKVKDFLPEDHKIDFEVLRSEAQTIDTWSPAEKVYAGYAAAAFPDLMDYTKGVVEKLKNAQAEIAKYRGAAPKSNSSGTAPTAPQQQRQAPSRKELAAKPWDEAATEGVSRIQRALGMGG